MSPRSWRFTLARQVYNLLIHLLIPLALAHFLWRSRREPAYRRQWRERVTATLRSDRVGRAPAESDRTEAGSGPSGSGPAEPDPAGPDLWIHAVSLGEMRVARILVDALMHTHPHLRIQLTTITPAGRAEGERMKTAGWPVAIRYLPLDAPLLVRRFIRKLQPRVLVIVETELWPNLLWQGHRAGLPILLVNARLSPSRRDTYRRFRALYAPLLANLHTVAAQGPDDAAQFQALGAPRVVVTGNLKFDLSPTVRSPELTRTRFAGARLWLAGSTHPGEEAVLLQVHRRLRQHQPEGSIQLLLAPRHPSRAPEIRAQAQQAGDTVELRSQMTSTASTADVVILDTLGELAALYALADVAFVGGSLVDHGGQNPLEAIAAGCPVIMGPDCRNFAEIVAQLAAHQALLQITDGDDLLAALRHLLHDPQQAQAMGRRAQHTLNANRGATAHTLRLLEPLLPPCPRI